MISDPIERIHPHDKAEALHGEYWNHLTRGDFEKFSKDRLFQHRTKYETKIPCYQEIVGKENVFTVYEEIFNGQMTFQNFASSTNLHVKPDITERVNGSKSSSY